ncbi:hypothetical protein M2139_001331 [Enterococcus sp. PF1-24]|uniref:hypothetical protein n=1 Tax=unclassified Enterococcus TaxID=2608891 RepID=UPI0024770202|nr:MULTISPECIES: hypothetical protein [unclassified Enterococcus]MDH6364364.1 hypothetical protein [Enterococcus sp. PFB1-1]MDH6401447.1 hypothetical protein [Enterococcus sp. PF1-24]
MNKNNKKEVIASFDANMLYRINAFKLKIMIAECLLVLLLIIGTSVYGFISLWIPVITFIFFYSDTNDNKDKPEAETPKEYTTFMIGMYLRKLDKQSLTQKAKEEEQRRKELLITKEVKNKTDIGEKEDWADF